MLSHLTRLRFLVFDTLTFNKSLNRALDHCLLSLPLQSAIVKRRWSLGRLGLANVFGSFIAV